MPMSSLPLIFFGSLSAFMWAVHKWSNSTILGIFLVLLAIWGMMQFFTGVSHIKRITRFWSAAEIRKAQSSIRKYRLKSESPTTQFTSLFMISGALILILGIFFEFRWIGIAVWLLGTGYVNNIRNIQPPFALVLGASGITSQKVASVATLACYPLKTINLLHVAEKKEFMDSYVKADTYRQNSSNLSWKEAVKELAQLAKVIVFDSRALNEAVHDEYFILEAADLWHKTIFVSDNPRRLPDGLFSEEDAKRIEAESFSTKQGDLNHWVSILANSPQHLPTKAQPLKESYNVIMRRNPGKPSRV